MLNELIKDTAVVLVKAKIQVLVLYSFVCSPPSLCRSYSAHDKFDATFKTNVLVNSSGFCEYLPPGM